MFSIGIIGGGAAGFFGAINCKQFNSNCNVTILEKSGKLLAKVKISGGGRCNVTNACFNNSLLVGYYPRGNKELLQAFSRFSTQDSINWFKERGILLKTESDGRIFPSTNNSETIVNYFLNEAKKNHIDIKLNSEVIKILQINNTFKVILKNREELLFDKLLIASGGSPRSDFYNWLRELGHTVIKPVPSLFTFNLKNNKITRLMGVSLEKVKIKIEGTAFSEEGPILITHWGFSGPSILKLSAYAAQFLNTQNYQFKITINWLPEFKHHEILKTLEKLRVENGSKFIYNFSGLSLPKRLWEYFLEEINIFETVKWGEVSNKNILKLAEKINSDCYCIEGKTTFKEEFVTCGGISLKEVDFKTMQSKIIKGLYFAGEVLDIDGITGGFNFQNAWTTSWIASKDMAEN